jgi:subtilisin
MPVARLRRFGAVFLLICLSAFVALGATAGAQADAAPSKSTASGAKDEGDLDAPWSEDETLDDAGSINGEQVDEDPAADEDWGVQMATNAIPGGIPMGNGQTLPYGVKRIGATESETAKIDGIDERVDVDVAVIDSGVSRRHEDLNVVGGINVSKKNPSSNFKDNIGHGTHIAGTIGALDNDRGVVGVAPGARIWAVKVSDNPDHISVDQAIRGLNWVARHSDVIDVANFSIGFNIDEELPEGSNARRRFDAAVDRVVQRGVTLVSASGHESENTARWAPASYPNVIGVSGFADTDGKPGGRGPDNLPDPRLKDDRFAYFSNFGRSVDISAPAGGVLSTLPGNDYLRGDGTSFAAAHVTGAAALFTANHPEATPAEVQRAIKDAREPGRIPGDPDDSNEGRLRVSTF